MWYKCKLIKPLPNIPVDTTFDLNLTRNPEDQSIESIAIVPDTPFSIQPDKYFHEQVVFEKLIERTLENNRIHEWLEMKPDEAELANLSCPACAGIKIHLVINEPKHVQTLPSGLKNYRIEVIAECGTCGHVYRLGVRSYSTR